MKEKDTRNPLFGLGMPFAEALERFIGTDRQEALRAEGNEAPEPSRRGPQLLTWQKNLSKTDAQQETTGGLVPYLRLTSGSLTSEDFQSWFRQELFSNAAWGAGEFNKKPVEEAHIPFRVTVHGLNLGPILFKVTHDDTRQNSHNAPNTWLHWPDSMASLLQNNDFSGRPVVLTRDDSGAFALEIQ